MEIIQVSGEEARRLIIIIVINWQWGKESILDTDLREKQWRFWVFFFFELLKVYFLFLKFYWNTVDL